jgi:hypothetical protein
MVGEDAPQSRRERVRSFRTEQNRMMLTNVARERRRLSYKAVSLRFQGKESFRFR